MLRWLVPQGSAVNYLLAAGPVPLLLSFLESTYLFSGLGHWVAYVIGGVRRSIPQPGVILLPPPRGGHRVKSGDICGHHS